MRSWGAGHRATATLIAGLLLAVAPGCAGDDQQATSTTTTSSTTSTSTSTSTTSSTTTTTTTPATPEQEVEAAYLRSWEVLASALRELDESELSEAFAEEALQLKLDEVRQLKADGTPVLIDVEHDLTIEILDADNALVIDRITNHSVLLDPRTMEPAEPDPNSSFTRTYQLRRNEGSWRVVVIKRV